MPNKEERGTDGTITGARLAYTDVPSGATPTAQRTGTVATDRCGGCELTVARLYLIPVHHRLGERAPRIACYFCYLRAVGASPRRKQLVSGG